METTTDCLQCRANVADGSDGLCERCRRPAAGFEVVRSILVDVMARDAARVTPEARLTEDLGLDSLDRWELAMAVEEELEISIPDSEIPGLVTVNDVVALALDLSNQ